MQFNIKPSYLIVFVITAIIASFLAVNITDYIRDHNEMQRQLIEKEQVIQQLEELKGVHESNAEQLKETVDNLKQVPAR